MGTSQSIFSHEELEAYQQLTFFTKKEIMHVYNRFKSLDDSNTDIRKMALKKEKIMALPELKANPFKDRICGVFSSNEDGSMSFDDFLDMMSVFSINAPRSVKVDYAFKIYDFDDDGTLSSKDIREVVLRLTRTETSDNAEENEKQLDDEEMQQLIDNILEEADLDDDDALSFPEFEHAMSKAPDFVNSFCIRL